MAKFIFLDLEGTVISDIFEQLLCNTCSVKEWLQTEGNPEFVGIFSFAIDNDLERNEFNSQCKPMLESALGTKVGRVVTTEQAQRTARSKHKVCFESLSEFKQLWGKERGFIDFCRETFTKCEVVLLDDMVEDMTVHIPDRDLLIRLVNVRNI